MRTINVKGTGNVSARPDYIILSLNIEAVSVGSSRPRFVGSNEPLFVGKPEANR